ncbi:transcriptional regulator [Halobacteroides halobius DSM 5150]|uniref:Transcriptional regulator n=1 Tax=Halobacteroides halobius (strain ATCC 35273 / DSM 5150 / MD-1) TaxID=748449 RepID=L0K513_HALHC|nr:MarR family transcriptional regulator [Halobacteroides halobius]AGB40342.1 transcriptional regulator [Halobacteroides halobius DSM 5150]
MKSLCSICSIDMAITISQLNKTLTREIKKECKRNKIADLHPTQGKALFLLKEKGCLRLSDLANELSLTKPTVTVLVKKLETEDYITRKTCSDDKRCNRIELTDTGKEILNTFLEVGDKINRQLFQGLSKEEKINCIDTLQKMIDNY